MKSQVDVLDGKQTLEEDVLHALHLWPYTQVPVDRLDTVLDVGCGHGVGTSILSCRTQSAMGIDLDCTVIDAAKLRFPDCDFRMTTLGKASLVLAEKIVAFQVLEHIVDDVAFLEEAKQALASDGMLYVTTPDRRFRLGPTEKPWNREHVREYTPEALAHSFRRAGFNAFRLRGIAAAPWMMNMELARIRRAKRLGRLDPLGLRRFVPWSWYYYPYRIFRQRLNVEKKLKSEFSCFWIDPYKEVGVDLWVEARNTV